MPELLTMEDVCRILGVTYKTIWREIKGMRLAGTKIGRGWRFTPEAIENYITSRTTKTKR